MLISNWFGPKLNERIKTILTHIIRNHYLCLKENPVWLFIVQLTVSACKTLKIWITVLGILEAIKNLNSNRKSSES